jgi:hypothetical protein
VSFAVGSFGRDSCCVGQGGAAKGFCGPSAAAANCACGSSMRTGGLAAWQSATCARVAALRRHVSWPAPHTRPLRSWGLQPHQGRRSVCESMCPKESTQTWRACLRLSHRTQSRRPVGTAGRAGWARMQTLSLPDCSAARGNRRNKSPCHGRTVAIGAVHPLLPRPQSEVTFDVLAWQQRSPVLPVRCWLLCNASVAADLCSGSCSSVSRTEPPQPSGS